MGPSICCAREGILGLLWRFAMSHDFFLSFFFCDFKIPCERVLLMLKLKILQSGWIDFL